MTAAGMVAPWVVPTAVLLANEKAETMAASMDISTVVPMEEKMVALTAASKERLMAVTKAFEMVFGTAVQTVTCLAASMAA